MLSHRQERPIESESGGGVYYIPTILQELLTAQVSNAQEKAPQASLALIRNGRDSLKAQKIVTHKRLMCAYKDPMSDGIYVKLLRS